MDSSAEEWQVVKPKRPKKKKVEKSESRSSSVTKAASPGSKTKANIDGNGNFSKPSSSQPIKSAGKNNKPTKKKSEQKRPAVMKMPLKTAEQMSFFIRELVVNTPPPSNKLSIAAIGEKILLITKHSWSKKYKSSFGSLRSFLESQVDLFTVIDEDVFLAGTVRKPSPMNAATRKPKDSSPTAKKSVSSKKQPDKPQKAAHHSSSRSSKKSSKQSHHSEQSHGIGCLRTLAVVGLMGAVIIFTLASVNVIDLKSIQRFAQQKFVSKR